MSANITNLNAANFDAEVKQATLPVLVDFWAPWCGPCKMVAPLLDELAVEMAGQIKIAKVNADENQEIVQQFGIRGIPTLMLFRNGEVLKTKVGALNKTQLTSFIQDTLGA